MDNIISKVKAKITASILSGGSSLKKNFDIQTWSGLVNNLATDDKSNLDSDLIEFLRNIVSKVWSSRILITLI